MMTIEDLKNKLESQRPSYVEETESVSGDELMYAQGQLAMLDLVLDMLEE